MKIFVVNNAQEQSEVLRINEKWLGTVRNSLWLDGKYEIDNAWFYYSYGRTPAFAGLDFVSTYDTKLERLCASANSGTGWHMDSRPKGDTYWFICETL